MKSKKKIIIIAVIAFVVIAIITSVVIYNVNKYNVTNVDMAKLDIDLLFEGNFSNNRMMNITKQEANEVFGIDTEDIEEIIGKMPVLNISSSMYVVIHTKKEKVAEMTEKLNDYAIKYEKEWESYLEGQYELVKNRKIGNKGNYVYLIITDEPDKLVKLIK
ncbi:MAG: DUF4358 domain-containing protein [Clostridia bacterium]|nr:DUF4358 domain-containing protein [Clostridia bacterium]